MFLLTGWIAGYAALVPEWAAIVLFVISYFFGARDNVGHFLGDLRKGRFHFNIDLLMVVAALVPRSLVSGPKVRCCSFSSALGMRWSTTHWVAPETRYRPLRSLHHRLPS